MKILQYALSALLIVLAGCNQLAFENPLTPSEGENFDATGFLGTWRLSEVVGEANAVETDIVVSAASGGLEVTYKPGGGPGITSPLVLTDINGVTVASTQRQGFWLIATVTLDEGGTQLNVRSLNMARIKQDIDAKVLSGSVEEIDDGDVLILASASSSELRAYLESTPDALFSPRTVSDWTLTRTQ